MSTTKWGGTVFAALIVLLTSILTTGYTLAASALPADSLPADSLAKQRERYAAIKKAWDQQQMPLVAALMPTLRDYPLYPYLQYRQLTDQLASVSIDQVQQFIDQHPGFSVNRTLKSRFINELARRQDWRGLLEFSPQPPAGNQSQCLYYIAKWHNGATDEAWQGARALWLNNNSQLNACQPLFAAWQQAGKRTLQDDQPRLLQQIKRGDWKQVAALAKQLPSSASSQSEALLTLSKTPEKLLPFVHSLAKTPFRDQLALETFSRLARSNTAQAQQLLPALKTALKADQPQRQRLDESLAWQLMSADPHSAQGQWRDQVIARSHSAALIERRLRLALASADLAGLQRWLAHLPIADQQKDEWRYWQAMVLWSPSSPEQTSAKQASAENSSTEKLSTEKLSTEKSSAEKRQQAKAILQALAKQRGFYPLLAAQQLQQTYVFNIHTAPAADNALLQNPQLARVRELKYWQQENNALSEWRALVEPLSAPQQAALARYANQQQWWDLAVQATITGKLWDHLPQRFPLAYQPLFQAALQNKTISLSYSMAIARQESAWNPRVRSVAGAMGLMQLMPATARHTAKKFHITDYQQTSQLQNPAINIALGTQYLQSVYQQFDNNRILAAAAYNAGPARVTSWLANSAGRLNAAAFIESIPFAETRGYVKNVLAYDVYYRYLLGQPQYLFTETEWQRQY